MPLTKEQLLIPRYMCTGTPGKPLWYGCHWKHGDIIKLDQTVDGLVCIYEDYKGRHFVKELYFSDYPHLFKPLQWWEMRDVIELPKYVKNIKNGRVFKAVWDCFKFKGVKEWSLILQQNGIPINPDGFKPATLSEYEEYLKQKEG